MDAHDYLTRVFTHTHFNLALTRKYMTHTPSTHTLALTLTRTHSHSHSHPLSLTLSHTHTFTHMHAYTWCVRTCEVDEHLRRSSIRSRGRKRNVPVTVSDDGWGGGSGIMDGEWPVVRYDS